MVKKLLLLTFLTFILNLAYAQSPLQQYFDGADTLSSKSIIIILDTSSSNIWQVGPPQKTIFDSAATNPNVLVTDTINTYPVNDTSIFTFKTHGLGWGSGGIIAVRWKQKLDMDFKKDGGIIEYSIDTGKTWLNVFHNTSVYNFYGFDTTNADTLTDGTFAFTGTDTVWRDIWLCYKIPVTPYGDFMFRFTFRSDNVDSNKEGWMIDNMLVQETFYHTVSTVAPQGTFLVFPTITNGIVKVTIGKDKQKIDNILILNKEGQVVRRSKGKINNATMDISGLPAGNYFVHIHSGDKIEVHKIVLIQ